MSPSRRSICDTIVYDAFEKHSSDAGQREAYARERCGGDAELLRAVLTELKAEDQIRQGAFLQTLSGAARWGAIPQGTRIGGFVIDELIGTGGMGTVYRALQPTLGRTVAIKFLHTRLASQAQQRFLLEAQSLGSIHSDRVVHVYSYDELSGQPYIVMEYLAGSNLHDQIQSGQCGGIASRLAIARQIAEGLADIHQAGIAHRDVKPSNVFVLPDGRIKLLDFGIAWRQDANLTQSGQVVGTPAYMAPEQILRNVRETGLAESEAYRRVDVYGFGILLYELLTGRLPFQGENRGDVEQQVVHGKISLEPLRAAKVPSEVVEMVRRATSRKPAERPSSCREMALTISRVLTGERASRAGAWKPRAAAAAIAVALALGASAYWGLPREPARPAAKVFPVPPAPTPVRTRTQEAEVGGLVPRVVPPALKEEANATSSGRRFQPLPPRTERANVIDEPLIESKTDASSNVPAFGSNTVVRPTPPPAPPAAATKDPRAEASAGIRQTIEEYAAAYSRKDLPALLRLTELPEPAQKSIRRMFSDARSIEMKVDAGAPTFPDGDDVTSATVVSQVSQRVAYRDGNVHRVPNQRLTLRLRRGAGGTWKIVSLE